MSRSAHINWTEVVREGERFDVVDMERSLFGTSANQGFSVGSCQTQISDSAFSRRRRIRKVLKARPKLPNRVDRRKGTV